MTADQYRTNQWIEILRGSFLNEYPVDIFGTDMKIISHAVDFPDFIHTFQFLNGTIIKLEQTL